MNVEIQIASELENGRIYVRANPMFRVGEIVKERGTWTFHHYAHADKLSKEEADMMRARLRTETTLMNIKERIKS